VLYFLYCEMEVAGKTVKSGSGPVRGGITKQIKTVFRCSSTGVCLNGFFCLGLHPLARG
jgi:hypothetical protein